MALGSGGGERFLPRVSKYTYLGVVLVHGMSISGGYCKR